MKNTVIAGLLTLISLGFSTSTVASDWIKFREDGYYVYVHKKIENSENASQVLMLNNRSHKVTITTTIKGKTVYEDKFKSGSSASLITIFCDSGTAYKSLEKFYEGPMASGDEIKDTTAMNIPIDEMKMEITPGSQIEALMKAVCRRR